MYKQMTEWYKVSGCGLDCAMRQCCGPCTVMLHHFNPSTAPLNISRDKLPCPQKLILTFARRGQQPVSE